MRRASKFIYKRGAQKPQSHCRGRTEPLIDTIEERMSRLDRTKRFAQKDSTLVESIKRTILGKARGMRVSHEFQTYNIGAQKCL
jgi:hypothetical protein